jgi:ribosomal protein L12E/L44/L45/RPP1/RPP2
MEGSCSTGQSPQWAVVPVEEEKEEEEEEEEEKEEEELSLHFVSVQ